MDDWKRRIGIKGAANGHANSKIFVLWGKIRGRIKNTTPGAIPWKRGNDFFFFLIAKKDHAVR